MSFRSVQTLADKTAYATASLNVDFNPPSNATAAVFHWDISAVGGTSPIADCKLQYKDPISGQYRDVLGASFGQATSAVRHQYLAVDPMATTIASTITSKVVSAHLVDDIRAVFTFDRTTGDETYTFTLGVTWIHGG